jgi:hypothetical protein
MRFSWDFGRWCFVLFHDVWWLDSKNTHETTSNKNLMKISQKFDEWVCVHAMGFSWMFGILLHAPSSWNIVEQNLTNVWRCSKRLHTMRLSWDFVGRCSQMFHVVSQMFYVVSQMFDVVSQKSHDRNLTRISSCGRALMSIFAPYCGYASCGPSNSVFIGEGESTAVYTWLIADVTFAIAEVGITGPKWCEIKTAVRRKMLNI